MILGRPFLVMGRALVDIELGQIKFRLNDKHVTFNVCKSMQQSINIRVVSMIDTISDDPLIVPIEERHMVEALAMFIMNFDSDGIIKYDDIVSALYGGGSYSYAPKNLDLNLKSRATPLVLPSI